MINWEAIFDMWGNYNYTSEQQNFICFSYKSKLRGMIIHTLTQVQLYSVKLETNSNATRQDFELLLTLLQLRVLLVRPHLKFNFVWS